jgi:ADP-ribose pyrophosphatase YjhB (NUDIX family)
MSCSYIALVDSHRLNAHAGDDAKEVGWFNIDYTLTNTIDSVEDGIKIVEKYYTLTLSNEDQNIVLKSEVCFKEHVAINGSWVDVIELNSDLAFDHARIIAYAIERLRNKLEYTTIAFNLLPETFTYTDLQMVCETILGRKLLSANFRRKMKKYVVPVDEFNPTNAGHRPAKLLKRSFI